LDDVEMTAQRLLLGAGRLGGDNLYWSDMRLAMMDAALSFLVAYGLPVAFETATDFMRGWFFSGTTEPPSVSQIIQHTAGILAKGGDRLPSGIRRKLQQAMDAASLFRTLDPRTRSNVQSTLLAGLRGIWSSRAHSLFEAKGQASFCADTIMQQGGVAVVSANAVTEPGLARLLFRCMKNDFYRAVQNRRGAEGPLCLLVMDEYPLAASTDDLENLQTLRSKGAAIIAATQGFITLDEELGVRPRQALIASFQNVIAMRCHEIEVDAQLFSMMGERDLEEPSEVDREAGQLIDWPPRPPRRRTVPVCPLGALSRLQTFEAFVSFANGVAPPYPVWIEPRFVDVRSTPTSPTASDRIDMLAEVAASVRGSVVPPPSLSPIFELMRRAGGRLLMPTPLWQAAAELCAPELPRELLVEQLTSFFGYRNGLRPRGLEGLPACWLRALPRLIEKHARRCWQGRIPFRLVSVTEESGALAMEFAEEQEIARREGEVSEWDVLRVHLNCHNYPSLWQPLRHRHWRHLHASRPELRSQLRVHAHVIGTSWPL
jgi:hypothetical protein